MSDLDPLYASALADDEEPRPGDPTRRSGQAHCANCGERLSGPFCAGCGQRDQPLRMPAHRFVAQSFTEFFGLDGRIWKTLRVLLFRPGLLTVDYVEGRRRRYLRPLRVYLTATLLLFLLVTLLDPAERLRESFAIADGFDPDSTVVVDAHLADVERQIEAGPQDAASARAVADSIRARVDSALAASAAAGADPGVVEVETLEDAIDVDSWPSADRLRRLRVEAAILRELPPDSSVRLLDLRVARAQIYPETSTDVDLPEWMARSESIRRLEQARTGQDAADAGIGLLRAAIGRIPTVLFLILPIYGLLLKLLYVRRGRYYSEHLVFALHTHAFTFLAFALVAVLVGFGGGGVWIQRLTTLLLVGVVPLYFLLAQKRVYRQGWGKTLAKALALGFVYSVVLFIGLIGTVLLAASVGG